MLDSGEDGCRRGEIEERRDEEQEEAKNERCTDEFQEGWMPKFCVTCEIFYFLFRKIVLEFREILQF